ncbi:hypothetical protein M6B38_332085 [Iris pallida]|uniref:Uncharacterized protein n=1 Tax=Iris pallida TaxID=29817 RepID=A0AAX6H441_IRIPA|nr:hypothetical protein M6B38_222755 [Iris pallida]KAJ6828230.1 hypothetical protein M6B38_364025 [Iris pallida]KAJ6835504.1 hypothetical protein M6B38_332085 [Iris pallida]
MDEDLLVSQERDRLLDKAAKGKAFRDEGIEALNCELRQLSISHRRLVDDGVSRSVEQDSVTQKMTKVIVPIKML